MDPVWEMRGITKGFPGVVANDGVDLTLYSGEIHALLGENGAGKSTLMNILTGIYTPDKGEIFHQGKQVRIKNPKTAVSMGIGMVHQHFKLIETLTVAENIFLAAGRRCPAMLNRKRMEDEILKCSQTFNLAVDPSALVSQLSVGEQQRVEIVKQLFCGANLLILDEPTAVLTPLETEQLFGNLRKMTAMGKSVLFITHKLYEVTEYSNRITILRGGKSVATMLTKETPQEQMVTQMVGRHIEKMPTERPVYEHPKAMLELKHITVKGRRGNHVLDDLSLTLQTGEIYGLAGVSGNGQRELTDVIIGLTRPNAGTITLDGQDMSKVSVAQACKKGIACIPEDRMETGLVGSMDMMENVILRRFQDQEFNRHGFLNRKAIQEKTMELVDTFAIKNAGIYRPVSLMSGGNLQKLLIAREISGLPKVIVAAYPVHGVDIGATESIHKILLEERKRGAAILLISEDLEELLEMSDRVGAICEGRIVGTIPIAEFTYEGVGLMMTGQITTATEGGATPCP
ncbi:MAG: ABC transporter ATP-binding protein [Eubacteriales bacterium]